MPRSFIKFLVPGHHGRSIHPEYFVFLVALSARIKTTKRINQMAMDGYGLYFGAKSNQSLAVDVDYGTCLIPYHSSSMERYFTEFLQRFILFVLGLTPYLYLPVRSWSEPYLTFFQYLPDWERVWWSIKREAYTSGDQSGTWHDSYLFIKQFFISLPAETGWPVLIAGSIGVLIFVFKYKLVISFSVLYTFFFPVLFY